MFGRLAPHSSPRFATLHPADSNTTTLQVPGYRQTRTYSCGFASALMVVRYCNSTITGEALFQSLGTGRSGTRQNALVRALRDAGLSANPRYDVDFRRICRAITRGKPIIGYLADTEHWIVIYGYGRQPDRLFVADPETGDGCEQPWAVYGARLAGFGIVCSGKPQRQPVHAHPLVDPPRHVELGHRPAEPHPAEPHPAGRRLDPARRPDPSRRPVHEPDRTSAAQLTFDFSPR